MSKSSSSSGPQQVKYSRRVALKKVVHPSDSSKEDEKLWKPSVVPSSDSEEPPPNAFMQRRAKNIEDNKAMVTMSKSSSASGPQQVKKYSLRVALKKVAYPSDSSEEDEKLKKPPVVPSSDSEEEPPPPPNAFMQRRAKNIEDNKAMLAKLMSELEKLPGHLEPDSSNQNHGTPKYSRRSRGSLVAAEPRRNPARAARRVTRSMGTVLPSSPEKDTDYQSLEDQLLEEREPTRRRQSSRQSIHTIPHVVRPVEEITEDDLKNVADNFKAKVYNTVSGSTCHQCRQKTIDTKTNCRNVECRGIQGQFCGPCLRIRYGEDVCKALLDPDWTCPPCRGICNCSFCRQKDGRCATGILFPVARYNGYSDVHSYLKSLQRSKNEPSDEDSP